METALARRIKNTPQRRKKIANKVFGNKEWLTFKEFGDKTGMTEERIIWARGEGYLTIAVSKKKNRRWEVSKESYEDDYLKEVLL